MRRHSGYSGIFFFMVALLLPMATYGMGEQIQTFSHADAVRQAVFSPDGKWMASGALGHQAKVWSPDSGAQRWGLTGGDVRAIGFTFDGSSVVTGTMYGGDLWNVLTGTHISSLNSYFVTDVSLSSTAPAVLTHSLVQRKADVYSTIDGHHLFTFPPAAARDLQYAVYSPDGSKIITGGDADNISPLAMIWDATTFTKLRELSVPGGPTTCVAFTPNSQKAFVACRDNSAFFFDVTTGTQVGSLTGNTAPIYYRRFSPDGSKLAAWGNPTGPNQLVPGTVWNTANGTAIQQFTSPGEFSPDGRYFAAQTADYNAVLLNASTFQQVCTFATAPNGVGFFSFSPDSARLAICTGPEVRIYYVGDGQPPVYCSDLFSDSVCGEGTLLVAGMPPLAPEVQAYFDTLGWRSWADADMEKFDLYVQGQPVTVGDGLPDMYQVALVQTVLQNPALPQHNLVAQQYEENRTLFNSDMDWLQQNIGGDFTGLKSYDELFAAMLGFSAEMQAAVNAFIKISTGSVTDLPHLASYHVFGLGSGAKTSSEPYSAQGDADHDGLSNLEEYQQVLSVGGSPQTFAAAALDPNNLWQGNPGLPIQDTTGIIALCVAIACVSVLTMRRSPIMWSEYR